MEKLYIISEDMNDIDTQEEIRLFSGIYLPNRIIAIGDISIWSGRRNGYKFIGTHFSNIFRTNHIDEAEWYVDKSGDIRSVQKHHDGTDYILFRLLRTSITNKQESNFTQHLVFKGLDKEVIQRYTVRLGDPYADYCGFGVNSRRPQLMKGINLC